MRPQWTDDTEMACSIYLTLATCGGIDQDVLAGSFARHHDFDRGYGPATNRMLRLVREGGDWRALAAELFDGTGSWGNGAAMRVSPLGAYFADDPAEAARQAELSAMVTHTHPEAVAGAIAVAVATAYAVRSPSAPGPFIDQILEHVPAGRVYDGIREARELLTVTDPEIAAYVLGNGRGVAAHDNGLGPRLSRRPPGTAPTTTAATFAGVFERGGIRAGRPRQGHGPLCAPANRPRSLTWPV